MTTSERARSYGDFLTQVIDQLTDELVSHELTLRLDQSPQVIGEMKSQARRLRTALSLFEPHLARKHAARARSALKSLTRALGLTREWDVPAQLLEQLHQQSSTSALQCAIEHLLERLKKKQDRSRQELGRSLQRIDFARLLKVTARSTRELSSAAIASTPAETARQALQPVIDAAQSSLLRDSWTASDLNEARAAWRKLRFAIECLQPILDEDVTPMLRRATEIEQQLARAGHQLALEGFLARAMVKLADSGRFALVAGTNEILERIRREHRALIAALPQLGRELQEGSPPLLAVAPPAPALGRHARKHRLKNGEEPISGAASNG